MDLNDIRDVETTAKENYKKSEPCRMMMYDIPIHIKFYKSIFKTI